MDGSPVEIGFLTKKGPEETKATGRPGFYGQSKSNDQIFY
jgi:hypothetical protein